MKVQSIRILHIKVRFNLLIIIEQNEGVPVLQITQSPNSKMINPKDYLSHPIMIKSERI